MHNAEYAKTSEVVHKKHHHKNVKPGKTGFYQIKTSALKDTTKKIKNQVID